MNYNNEWIHVNHKQNTLDGNDDDDDKQMMQSYIFLTTRRKYFNAENGTFLKQYISDTWRNSIFVAWKKVQKMLKKNVTLKSPLKEAFFSFVDFKEPSTHSCVEEKERRIIHYSWYDNDVYELLKTFT